MKHRCKELILDLIYYLLGGVSFAVSVSYFTAPNRIAPAGVTGIATVLNLFFSVPIGTMIIYINLPLLWIGWKRLGRSFIVKTAIVTLLYSTLVDLTSMLLPHYEGNRLLAAIYGGVLSGIGLAFAFWRGASTGGTDILARYFARKKSGISLGKTILFLDCFTIVFSTIAYWDIDSGLYAVVVAFVSGSVIDRFLNGIDSGKIFCIFSARYQEITALLTHRLCRGATLLNSNGGFTGRKSCMLLCAVRKNEISAVERIIKECDPKAFFFVYDATQISGEGFENHIK